jgi:hypothetical protein
VAVPQMDFLSKLLHDEIMPCAEREKLMRLLMNAVLAYSEAVRSMSGAEGNAIQQARQRRLQMTEGRWNGSTTGLAS